jgi:PAS domain S-box-containing protein
MDHFFLWPAALGVTTAVLVVCLVLYLRARRSRELLREQNVLLDAALGNMAQGLNMFDRAGRLVLSNERYIEMYRLPPAAVKPGVTVRELVELRLAARTFFKTDPNQYANALMSSIVDRKPTQATLELADGRVINVANQPMEGGGWVVTHKDVTERWIAERELESTRNFLHTVIENVPATIAVKDADTLTYALVNRAAEQFYGIARERMIGKRAEDVFPAATAALFAAHDRQLLESRTKLFFDEHPIELPGNGRRIITTTRLPILDDNGKPRHLLTVIQDVTERKRAEAQIERLAHYDSLTDLRTGPPSINASRRCWSGRPSRTKASRCCASTSTASRRSTTCSGIRSAIGCCARWRNA